MRSKLTPTESTILTRAARLADDRFHKLRLFDIEVKFQRAGKLQVNTLSAISDSLMKTYVKLEAMEELIEALGTTDLMEAWEEVLESAHAAGMGEREAQWQSKLEVMD